MTSLIMFMPHAIKLPLPLYPFTPLHLDISRVQVDCIKMSNSFIFMSVLNVHVMRTELYLVAVSRRWIDPAVSVCIDVVLMKLQITAGCVGVVMLLTLSCLSCPPRTFTHKRSTSITISSQLTCGEAFCGTRLGYPRALLHSHSAVTRCWGHQA